MDTNKVAELLGARYNHAVHSEPVKRVMDYATSIEQELATARLDPMRAWIKVLREFFHELLKAWALISGIIIGALVLGAPLWLFIWGIGKLATHAG